MTPAPGPSASPAAASGPARAAGRQLPLLPSDPVTRIPGVGRAKAEVYARLGVACVEELLRLAPRRFEDRRRVQSARDLLALPPGTPGTWVGTLVSSRLVRARGGLSIVEAAGEDDTGRVVARWWNQPWLARSLAVGSRVLLHGEVRRVTPTAGRGRSTSAPAGPRAEFSAPAVERVEPDGGPQPGVGRLVPVHPLTTGLSAAAARRAVWNAMPAASSMEDPLPPRLRERFGDAAAAVPPSVGALPSLADAVRALHFPEAEEESRRARARFAFDELIVHELLLARRRAVRRLAPAAPFRFTPELDRRIRARLPFRLTPAQDRAVAEIRADLERTQPMSRLLQGDVGSGKTLVAAYACLACVANGRQAAFMAPTEILARQHEATLRRLLAGSDVGVETLCGGRAGKARAAAAGRVESGEARLVVGTHAVLSRDVRFQDLGLVVVDEQHKFGVRQRRELLVKGAGALVPHTLVMTATPIPRTLAMVVYGDLDLTVIDAMPPGRGVRTTWVASDAQTDEVVARVRAEVERGRQAFVVYPLVRESDRAGLRDATAGREAWAHALPGRGVGLVHGQMKSAERDATMEAFRRGALDVLVATVVVEVGVDVPNATVLVVEHAERFGLSQLHQLRGRVGRGAGGGLCVLVDRSPGATPERLRALERTEDGFAIAEEDLRLRGGGDLFGTRQSGAPDFACARLPEDLPILLRARGAAASLVAADPALAAPDAAGLLARVLARERALPDPTAGG